MKNETKSASEVKTKMEELNKVLSEVGSEVYGKMNNTGQGVGANAEASEKSGDEKVVDAEFEDKNKKK